MSLKIFHFIFIGASTLLAFGFAAWGLHLYYTEGALRGLIWGSGSLAAGIALILYENAMVRKLKHLD